MQFHKTYGLISQQSVKNVEMKSLIIYLLATAAYIVYIQTQIAGFMGEDGYQNGIFPLQVSSKGFIMNSMALMISIERRTMTAHSGGTGRCTKNRMQASSITEMKPGWRYRRSMAAKQSSLSTRTEPAKRFRNAGASYFRDKDKMARKCLKDHPIPARFLQP